MPEYAWLHYADHALDPIRRSSSGSNEAIADSQTGSFVKYGKDPQENDLKTCDLQAGRSLQDAQWGSDDPAHWGSLLLARAGGIDERRVPTQAGTYPSFYRGVSQAIRSGNPPPVDPQSVIPVIRILEDLARQAGEG